MANRFLSNIRINDAYTLPASDGTTGQVITTDGAGNLSFSDSAAGGGAASIKRDNFTGDGTTVTFTLAYSVSSEDQSQVYIDGVYQEKGTYVLSGNVLTFDTAPLSGHSIEVMSILGIDARPTVLYQDNFTADGVATDFTLAQSIDNEIKTFVFLNGVYQFKGTYSLSGTTLSFDAAPENGTLIEIISLTNINFEGDYVLDSLQFTGGTGTQGTLSWNTEDETLDLIVSPDVTYQLGQELGHVVRNLSGATLNNGNVVRVTGASGNKITVDIADSSTEVDSSATFAVVTETINNNSTGRVTTEGLVRGLNTLGLTEGAALWLGTNGAFTTTKPLSPNHLVHIGWVVRAHETEGAILVRVSNGWELEELHDVLITSVADKDMLVWDSANGYWENSKMLGDITATSLAVDTNTLYVDAVNNRVGIGTSSPNQALTIQKSGYPIINFYDSTTARGDIGFNTGTTSFNISSYSTIPMAIYTNSAERMRIDSSGRVGIGTSTFGSFDKVRITGTNTVANDLVLATPNTAQSRIFFSDTDAEGVGELGYDHASNAMRIVTNGSERLRIDSSGNVGIGRTPSYKLDVADFGGSDVTIHISSNQTASGILAFGDNAAAARGYVEYDHVTNNLILGTTATERMRIDSSGNVGIGASDITAVGNYKVLELNGTTAQGAYLRLSGDNVEQGYIFSTSSGLTYVTNGATYHRFIQNGSERMRIDSAGNVGIGTSSPVRVLDARGASSNFGNFFLVDTTSGTTGTGGGIIFGSDNGSGTDISYAVIQGIKENSTAGNTAGALRFITKNSAGTLLEHARFNSGGDFVPAVNNSRDLGSSSLTFRNLYLGTSVYLGGTAAANALDDYEEGTWTPTITGTTSNPSVTYVTSYTGGVYTKIGNVVHVSFEVRWSAISGGLGDVLISGLPFTRRDTTQPDGDRFTLDSYNNTIPGLYLMAGVVRGTNTIGIAANVSGSPTVPFTMSHLSNSNPTFLRGTVTYFV